MTKSLICYLCLRPLLISSWCRHLSLLSLLPVVFIIVKFSHFSVLFASICSTVVQQLLPELSLELVWTRGLCSSSAPPRRDLAHALKSSLSPSFSTPLAPPTPCSFSISRWRLSGHSQADRWPLIVSQRDLWLSDFLRQLYFRDPTQLSLFLTSLPGLIRFLK